MEGDHTLAHGTVTVLFTDVEGSTEFRTRFGDDVANEILRAHEELVRAEVARTDGREIKALGDGFMVVFASARRAVECAVGIQRALALHNRRNQQHQVRVRIGINAGEAVEDRGDFFGQAVNAAARIAAKAKGGQVLVSDVVRQLAGDVPDLEFGDAGRATLKGLAGRWRLHEVIWRQEAPRLELDRTPLVGRQQEREALRACVRELLEGKGNLVLIGGEPGIGKTRLAEEVGAEARAGGALSFTGRCHDVEGLAAYAPFVEIMETALRAAGREAFREILGEEAPEIARIMPQLRRLYPDLPAPLELPPEQERRYLFNSILSFIERAARPAPVVIVLDDVHWADASLLLLIRHIAPRLSEIPVLILATYRDVELDVSRPLARTLADLLRSHLARRISLKRLSQDDVGSMLLALAGQEPPPPLVAAVFEQTEGNPFFVEEVVRHLAEEESLLDASGRLRADPGQVDVPESVRLVIGRRLERLSDDTRRVLAAAAVIGRTFRYELLEALGEVESEVLLEAVDSAVAARLIVQNEEGSEAILSFAHELIRQTLLASLSVPRRQRLHARMGQAIERLYASTIQDHAGEVLHHLYHAGPGVDPDAILRYLTMAGDRAMEAATFEEAVAVYEQALVVADQGDVRLRADLLSRLGGAQRAIGRTEEAITTLREVFAIYEREGDLAGLRRSSRTLANLLAWSGRWREGLEVTRRALEVIGEEPTLDRAILMAAKGMLMSGIGELLEGGELIERALALAERLGDRHVLGECLYVATAHHSLCWQPREMLQIGLRARDIARETASPWQESSILHLLVLSLTLLGRFDDARSVADEEIALADRMGHLAALTNTKFARMAIDWAVEGDLEGYEDAAREGLRLSHRVAQITESSFHMALGVGAFYGGRWDEAGGHFRRAEGVGPIGFGGQAEGYLMRHLAYAGEREEALRLATEHASRFPRPSQTNLVGSWQLALTAAEAFAVLGEDARAAALYPAILELIAGGGVVRDIDARLNQTVAGIAASAAGRWDAAEEHFRTALRQADELPVRLEQPEVRRFYGGMLLDRDGADDRAHARRLLVEAIEGYRRMGMRRHVELAEEDLARAR